MVRRFGEIDCAATRRSSSVPASRNTDPATSHVNALGLGASHAGAASGSVVVGDVVTVTRRRIVARRAGPRTRRALTKSGGTATISGIGVKDARLKSQSAISGQRGHPMDATQ